MISIVIPTWNHLEDCLKPCLESIIKHTDLSRVEVLIVANGCTDNTKEYVESLGDSFKLLWYSKPLGFPKATNKGIKKAKGDYVLLLNNDTIIQGDNWLDKLIEPFKDPLVKLTGAHKLSNHVRREFIVGWCMMIDRTVFKELGTLNEDYGWGAGEDIEFSWKIEDAGYKWVQVNVPIRHLGEKTVHDNNPELTLDDWNKNFWKNMEKVNKLSDISRKGLDNNNERAVISSYDNMDKFPIEKARYEWAAQNMTGKKVLELGCSSGYGQRMLGDIDYTGYDYDQPVLDYAKKHFPKGKYKKFDLEKEKIEGHWDTIIAFEVLEHLDNCKEIAQELKKHCDTLLCTVPYKEPEGMWGPHHKVHGLSESDFPYFEYYYLSMDGRVTNKPDDNYKIWVDGVLKVAHLMLMKWTK